MTTHFLESIGPHSYESGRAESPTESLISHEQSEFSVRTCPSMLEPASRNSSSSHVKLNWTVPPCSATLSSSEEKKKKFKPRPLPAQPPLNQQSGQPNGVKSTSPSSHSYSVPSKKARRNSNRELPRPPLPDIPESPVPTESAGSEVSTASDRRPPPPPPPDKIYDQIDQPPNTLPAERPSPARIASENMARRRPPPVPPVGAQNNYNNTQPNQVNSSHYLNSNLPIQTTYQEVVKVKTVVMICIVCFFFCIATLGLHFYLFFGGPGVGMQPALSLEQVCNNSVERSPPNCSQYTEKDVKEVFHNITKAEYCHVTFHDTCNKGGELCTLSDKKCCPTFKNGHITIHIKLEGVYYLYATLTFVNPINQTWNFTNHDTVLLHGDSRGSCPNEENQKVTYFTGGVFLLHGGAEVSLNVSNASQVMKEKSSFGFYRIKGYSFKKDRTLK